MTGFRITDPGVVIDYVESVHGPTEMLLGIRLDWDAVAAEVGRRTEVAIERDGAFLTKAKVGSFLCQKRL